LSLYYPCETTRPDVVYMHGLQMGYIAKTRLYQKWFLVIPRQAKTALTSLTNYSASVKHRQIIHKR